MQQLPREIAGQAAEPGDLHETSPATRRSACGLIAAAELEREAERCSYGSYPITPASDDPTRTRQAQELRCADVSGRGRDCRGDLRHRGRVHGGAMAVTGISGPGIALKGEKQWGSRLIMELPSASCSSIQRGGPSDRAAHQDRSSPTCSRPRCSGGNGEAPLPMRIAACSPAGLLRHRPIEAWRIATRFMTPVILLSDGIHRQWRRAVVNLPDPVELALKIPIKSRPDPPVLEDGELRSCPTQRDERDPLTPMGVAGQPGTRCIASASLEKQDSLTGNVSLTTRTTTSTMVTGESPQRSQACGRRHPRTAGHRSTREGS